ncbi:MAG: acyl-CoA dehydrogenase [Saccharothrix sp.]|nr:acyl-CoA dehydrogenase [Saccharothrix sp.]
MSTVVVPSREDLVRRVAEIAPVLRANAEWSVENRRLHEESVKALTDAGVFRMRVPRRYGGYESDALSMVEVGDQIAQADGSAAWVVACSWISTWALGMFPDSVQDEVFADPDVQVCTTIGAGAVTAVPVDGGILVNGTWPAISGALSARYQQIGAIFLDPNGQPYPVMAPVEVSQLEISDDWHTTGFRGTGSVGTTAKDLFVPQERVRPAPAILLGQSASQLNAGSAMYRAPFVTQGAAATVGIGLGMAKAIRDAFLERLPGRKHTYTEYPSLADSAVTHLRISEAMMKIDEAEFHARRIGLEIDAKNAAGAEWTMLERARARADEGAAVRLAQEAAAIFAGTSGGSSAYTKVPIQRINNDLQTYSLHALMTPDYNYEIYGRLLSGLEPNTYYL